MKQATYKIPQSVNVEELRGREVKTREAETLAEFHQLVESGDENNVLKLAQSAYDIIVQRKVREYVESEEAQTLAKNGDFEAIVTGAQQVADDYIYGARAQSTGKAAVTRKKAEGFEKIAEKAKTDPRAAALLAELGIEL